ncbi:hypothetical protein UPYG_G00167260 [Umbra pygmaea]|uniref:R3H domain-containing protein n=1 Tax=Umbra pygmaea TaxID=75934 RepID=A0ABD0WSV2_UMBPY
MHCASHRFPVVLILNTSSTFCLLKRANLTPLINLAYRCFLPKQENEFIHTVMEELDTYLQRENHKSILLFPPLPSRLRYLVHNTTEKYPDLATFSVGDGWSRRVVVCYAHLRLQPEDDSDKDSNSSFYEEAPVRRGVMQSSNPAARRSRGNSRRPDKAIYIPRAARDRQRGSSGSIPVVQSQVDIKQDLHALSCTSSEPCCYSTRKHSDELLSETTSVPHTCLDSVPTIISDTGREEGDWPLAWDPTLSYFQALSLEDWAGIEQNQVHIPEDVLLEKGSLGNSIDVPPKHNDSHTDADADSAYFHQQIIARLSEEDVTIEHAQNDYSSYEDVFINQDEFAHVIEIYNFSSVFKTEDLLDAFSDYSDGGIKIKWVDDTHALGVFSSPCAATRALSIQHPLLKTRPLSDGSKKAKGKAIRRAEFLQPVKERPQTDAAVARRMVTRALGIQRARGRTPPF